MIKNYYFRVIDKITDILEKNTYSKVKHTLGSQEEMLVGVEFSLEASVDDFNSRVLKCYDVMCSST